MRRERASCRPPSAVLALSPLESDSAARQASRSWSTQSSCSLFRPLGISPLGTPSMASSRLAAALFSASTVMPGVLPGPGRGGVHHRHGELAGHGAGDPVLQFVRLVHHHDVVLGQHRQALEGADGEHGVVGDHDVGVGGVLPGQFAEAFGRERAFLRAEALHGGDRDLAPGPVRDAGHELVAVPRRGVLGPFAQPDDFLAELGGRPAHRGGEMRHGGVLAEGEQLSLGRFFGREAALEFVPADVVGRGP